MAEEKKDKAENELGLASDCGWIRGLDAAGKPIRISKADMVELIRANMPVATREQNGLMSKDGIQSIGNISDNSLEDIGSSFGYAYSTNDQSGLAGPFLSIYGGGSCIQLKASYDGISLKFRTYNQTNNTWTHWKSISFT